MDPKLERVIRRTLANAAAKGQDYLTQTELAVRAAQHTSPGLTAPEALAAVNLVRRS